MDLLAATWTGAIATGLLVIGAGVTGWFARKAFLSQDQQTRLLAEQVKRDVTQRRRAQASQVFVWIQDQPFGDDPADPRSAALVRNTSSQPVYDLTLGLGEAGDQRWPVLMPDKDVERVGLGTEFASGERPVWATFRDSSGIKWRITVGGELTEIA
jgi:hypothetical protein